MFKKINLSNYQKVAFRKVIEEYEHGGDSALVLMPPGAGKTVLSMRFLHYIINKGNSIRIAHVSPTKATSLYFTKIMAKEIGDFGTQCSPYTYTDLLNKIFDKTINADSYDVVIFDGLDELREIDSGDLSYAYMLNYFNCFKVGFSRDISSDVISKYKVVYEYSYEQSVLDGSFISLQKHIRENQLDNFYDVIENINIEDSLPQNLKDSMLNEISALKKENQDFQKAFKMLLEGRLKKDELIEISCRVEQLEVFSRLLDDDFVDFESTKLTKGVEAVWQEFFETNQWIFGFGLNYIFNSSLDGDKLEKTVVGFDVTGAGKRVDALLKTTGLIQTLSFGEIKTHRTTILKKVTKAYRAESWSVSDELAGAIAQVQRTVQESLINISSKLSTYDSEGYKRMDSIYLYKPKAFLIIGSLNEFQNEKGEINESKFSSFELFRRSISDIEIITFDELYSRACALMHKSVV